MFQEHEFHVFLNKGFGKVYERKKKKQRKPSVDYHGIRMLVTWFSLLDQFYYESEIKTLELVGNMEESSSCRDLAAKPFWKVTTLKAEKQVGAKH